MSEETPVSLLVVSSKVKAAIKEKGMNTSYGAIVSLSKLVEDTVAVAVTSATKEGRKTVMDRDIPLVKLNE